MQIRGTAAGLVVLGLVLGGVFWARGWRSSAGLEGPVSQESRGSPSPAGSGPAAAADATLPDVTLADAVVELGDVRLTLSVTPRPPVALQTKRFRVRVESSSAGAAADTSGGTPLALEGGRISFEMTMPMGEHRYTLARGAGGWQEAEVVLPFCTSGNPRWYALVEGAVAGRPVAARFRVDLTKPRAPQ